MHFLPTNLQIGANSRRHLRGDLRAKNPANLAIIRFDSVTFKRAVLSENADYYSYPFSLPWSGDFLRPTMDGMTVISGKTRGGIRRTSGEIIHLSAMPLMQFINWITFTAVERVGTQSRQYCRQWTCPPTRQLVGRSADRKVDPVLTATQVSCFTRTRFSQDEWATGQLTEVNWRIYEAKHKRFLTDKLWEDFIAWFKVNKGGIVERGK